MTVDEFLAGLGSINLEKLPKGQFGLSPIRLDESDRLAARLLLWLKDHMRPEVTQKEIEDVLDSAKWWIMFIGASSIGTASREDTNV